MMWKLSSSILLLIIQLGVMTVHGQDTVTVDRPTAAALVADKDQMMQQEVESATIIKPPIFRPPPGVPVSTAPKL
jgi:hypothetical protein